MFRSVFFELVCKDFAPMIDHTRDIALAYWLWEYRE